MVDSAKTFIIVIVSFIVALSVISFGAKVYEEKSEKDSTFVLSVGTSTQATAATTTKTNGTKPTTTTTQPKSSQPTTIITPNVKTNYTVRYTKDGFTPVTLHIKQGQSVRFLNDSSMSMKVYSAVSPNSGITAELNQSSSVGKGGYYDFTFTKKGTFIYYNLNDKNKAGAVIVE